MFKLAGVTRIGAAAVVILAACKGGEPAPVAVARLEVTPTNPSLAADDSVVLTAQPLDAAGRPLPGRKVAWRSEASFVASVSQTGVVTGIEEGSTGIVASSEGREQRTAVTVTPPRLASIALVPPVFPVRVGRSHKLEVVLRNSRGQQVSGLPLSFTSTNPGGATVTADGVVSALIEGATTTIRASSGAVFGEFTFTVARAQQPRISSIEPAVLASETIATVRGVELREEVLPAPPRVVIGGQEAAVVVSNDTLLQFRVPCVASGTFDLHATISQQVTTRRVTLATPEATLGVGRTLTLPATSAHCVRLQVPTSPSRYLIMGSHTSTSPNTVSALGISGNPGSDGNITAPRVIAPPRFTLSQVRDDAFTHDTAHLHFMERERALFQALRSAPPERPSLRRAATVPVVGEIRPFFFTFTGGCGDTTRVVQARAIRVGTRAIIWEDTTNAILSTREAALAGYYERLGKQFDDEQYDVVRKYFGDPLRRDGETDADGRLGMVFTQRLIGTGAAAYVTSCDQRTRATAPGSNVGEYFYGSVPTTAESNLNSTSAPDGWFYFMGRTVIHEVKHIASTAARAANNAPTFEQSWLEEGTARHAEELWVRDYVHRVPWKGNTGFGTASTNGLYCDFHPSDATCAAADPLHRPTYGMRRQFNEIREKLIAPWDWSPFGNATGQAGAIFYQTAWSLVRYAIDRYAVSDSAFFQKLTNATLSGVPNLEATAGAPIAEMLGGWGLALYADDYPGFTALAETATRFPTWNLRNIYEGLNSAPAWSARWPAAFPLNSTQLTFGKFVASRGGIRGGAHAYFELSGTATEPQLLRLTSSAGMHVTILRLQ